MAIKNIGLTGTTAGAIGSAAAGTAAPGFEDALKGLVNSVETTGAEANTAVSDMLDGTGEVHDAMIALQRAEMTLQLTMQVRNKLIHAYQEIMRMPV